MNPLIGTIYVMISTFGTPQPSVMGIYSSDARCHSEMATMTNMHVPTYCSPASVDKTIADIIKRDDMAADMRAATSNGGRH